MVQSQRSGLVLGDAVPAAVTAYYRAADAGRFEEAAEQMGLDVLIALPPRGGHEIHPRQVARGRQTARDLLAARGALPQHHEIVLCVVEGPSCMVEGLIRANASSEPVRSFVGAFQLDANGLIARYLAFSCEPPVALPPRSDSPASARSAEAAVRGYFDSLDSGRFEESAAWFSEDVIYCHPPYKHTGITSNRRVDFIGRSELLAAFRERGKTQFVHRVLELIQRGPNALFEVVTEGLPGAAFGSAVCSLSLDDDGRIRRYLAFYTEPGVEQI